MERESELVKVTGIMSLLRAAGAEREELKGVARGSGWQLVWGGKWSWRSFVLHLCLPREHPAAVALPARGSELAACAYFCTARSLLPLTVYRASAAIRTVTGFLHTA